MSIKFAKFIDGANEIIIKAKEIKSRKEYINKYRGKLFCNEPSCNAQLEWADLKNGPIFRKWKLSEHADKCMYKVISERKNRPQKNGHTVLASVSDEHIINSLRRANIKHKEDQGIILPIKNKKKNKTTDKNKDSFSPIRVVSAVNLKAKTIESIDREPPLQQRDCNDLLKEDIGQSRVVRGYIDRAEIKEDQIKFIYKTNKSEIVKILFFDAFKNSNLQDFEWIKYIGKHINQGNCLYVTCVGEIKYFDEIYSIQIMSSIRIWIEEMNFSQYINKLTQTRLLNI